MTPEWLRRLRQGIWSDPTDEERQAAEAADAYTPLPTTPTSTPPLTRGFTSFPQASAAPEPWDLAPEPWDLVPAPDAATSSASGVSTNASAVSALPTGAPADGVEQWDSLIREASQTYGVPPSVIKGIMDLESGGGDPTRSSPPSAGGQARGLMQIHDVNWRPGEDPYDPRTNIFKGTQMLADHYRRYGDWNKAAAAYYGAADFETGEPNDSSDASGVTGPQYVSIFQERRNKYLASDTAPASVPTAEPDPDAVRAQQDATGTWATAPSALPTSADPDPPLRTLDAYLVAGPAATEAFYRVYGRNPTAAEARDAAQTVVDWRAAQPEQGPQLDAQLIRSLGGQAEATPELDPTRLTAALEQGNAVVLETPQRYAVISGYDPSSSQFFFGESGTDLGGTPWMTLDTFRQLAQADGGLRGALYRDDPTTQTSLIGPPAPTPEAPTTAPLLDDPTTGDPTDTAEPFRSPSLWSTPPRARRQAPVASSTPAVPDGALNDFPQQGLSNLSDATPAPPGQAVETVGANYPSQARTPVAQQTWFTQNIWPTLSAELDSLQGRAAQPVFPEQSRWAMKDTKAALSDPSLTPEAFNRLVEDPWVRTKSGYERTINSQLPGNIKPLASAFGPTGADLLEAESVQATMRVAAQDAAFRERSYAEQQAAVQQHMVLYPTQYPVTIKYLEQQKAFLDAEAEVKAIEPRQLDYTKIPLDPWSVYGGEALAGTAELAASTGRGLVGLELDSPLVNKVGTYVYVTAARYVRENPELRAYAELHKDEIKLDPQEIWNDPASLAVSWPVISGRLTPSIAQNIAQIGVMALLNLATRGAVSRGLVGPAAVKAVQAFGTGLTVLSTYLSESGEQFGEALDKGVDWSTARNVGIATGAVNAAIEIGINWEDAIAFKLFSRAEADVAKDVAKTTLAQNLAAAGKELALATTGEMAEEGLQNTWGQALTMTYDKLATLFDNLGASMLMGALGGAAMGVPGALKTTLLGAPRTAEARELARTEAAELEALRTAPPAGQGTDAAADKLTEDLVGQGQARPTAAQASPTEQAATQLQQLAVLRDREAQIAQADAEPGAPVALPASAVEDRAQAVLADLDTPTFSTLSQRLADTNSPSVQRWVAAERARRAATEDTAAVPQLVGPTDALSASAPVAERPPTPPDLTGSDLAMPDARPMPSAPAPVEVASVPSAGATDAPPRVDQATLLPVNAQGLARVTVVGPTREVQQLEARLDLGVQTTLPTGSPLRVYDRQPTLARGERAVTVFVTPAQLTLSEQATTGRLEYRPRAQGVQLQGRTDARTPTERARAAQATPYPPAPALPSANSVATAPIHVARGYGGIDFSGQQASAPVDGALRVYGQVNATPQPVLEQIAQAPYAQRIARALADQATRIGRLVSAAAVGAEQATPSRFLGLAWMPNFKATNQARGVDARTNGVLVNAHEVLRETLNWAAANDVAPWSPEFQGRLAVALVGAQVHEQAHDLMNHHGADFDALVTTLMRTTQVQAAVDAVLASLSALSAADQQAWTSDLQTLLQGGSRGQTTVRQDAGRDGALGVAEPAAEPARAGPAAAGGRAAGDAAGGERRAAPAGLGGSAVESPRATAELGSVADDVSRDGRGASDTAARPVDAADGRAAGAPDAVTDPARVAPPPQAAPPIDAELYAEIQARAQAGDFGAAVWPSTLAERYGLSMSTAGAVVRQLRAEGLLGTGNRVTAAPSAVAPTETATSPTEQTALDRLVGRLEQVLDRRLGRTTPDDARGMPSEDAPAAAKTISMSFGEDFYAKFRQQYKNTTLGKTLVKELVQNSVDAVRAVPKVDEAGYPTNPRIKVYADVAYNEDMVHITVLDDGVGMTPEVIENAYLKLGNSVKAKEASGGFGTAKIAFLANTDDVVVHTIARRADGSFVESILILKQRGTTEPPTFNYWSGDVGQYPEAYALANTRPLQQELRAMREPRTGTQVYVAYRNADDVPPETLPIDATDEDRMLAQYEQDSRNRGQQQKTFQELLNYIRLTDYVQQSAPEYLNQPVDFFVRNPQTYKMERLTIDSPQMRGESALDTWSIVTPTVPLTSPLSFTADSSVFTLQAAEQFTDTGFATTLLLNNGLFQESSYVSLPAGIKVPQYYIINIQTTADTRSRAYPWSSDRTSITKKYTDSIAKFIVENFVQKIQLQEISLSRESWHDAARIPGTLARIVNTSNAQTPEVRTLMNTWASRGWVQQLARMLPEAADVVIDEIAKDDGLTASNIVQMMPTPMMAGFELAINRFGANYPATFFETTDNVILVNPWLATRSAVAGSARADAQTRVPLQVRFNPSTRAWEFSVDDTPRDGLSPDLQQRAQQALQLRNISSNTVAEGLRGIAAAWQHAGLQASPIITEQSFSSENLQTLDTQDRSVLIMSPYTFITPRVLARDRASAEATIVFQTELVYTNDPTFKANFGQVTTRSRTDRARFINIPIRIVTNALFGELLPSPKYDKNTQKFSIEFRGLQFSFSVQELLDILNTEPDFQALVVGGADPTMMGYAVAGFQKRVLAFVDELQQDVYEDGVPYGARFYEFQSLESLASRVISEFIAASVLYDDSLQPLMNLEVVVGELAGVVDPYADTPQFTYVLTDTGAIELSGPDSVSEARLALFRQRLTESLTSTLIHEVTHQGYRHHRESFSSALTWYFGTTFKPTYQVVSRAVESISDEELRVLMTTDLGAYEDQVMSAGVHTLFEKAAESRTPYTPRTTGALPQGDRRDSTDTIQLRSTGDDVRYGDLAADGPRDAANLAAPGGAGWLRPDAAARRGRGDLSRDPTFGRDSGLPASPRSSTDAQGTAGARQSLAGPASQAARGDDAATLPGEPGAAIRNQSVGRASDRGPAAQPAGRGGAAELDLPQLAPLDEPRDVDTARGMPSEDAPERVRMAAGASLLRDMSNYQYSGEPLQQVAVKELVQNAVDAAREAIRAGEIATGEVNVLVQFETTPEARAAENGGTDEQVPYVVVWDNGLGMTPDVVRTAFVEVGTSTKRGTGGAGGFGTAKLAFLGRSAKIVVRTVAQDADGQYVETVLVGSGQAALDSSEAGGLLVRKGAVDTVLDDGDPTSEWSQQLGKPHLVLTEPWAPFAQDQPQTGTRIYVAFEQDQKDAARAGTERWMAMFQETEQLEQDQTSPVRVLFGQLDPQSRAWEDYPLDGVLPTLDRFAFERPVTTADRSSPARAQTRFVIQVGGTRSERFGSQAILLNNGLPQVMVPLYPEDTDDSKVTPTSQLPNYLIVDVQSSAIPGSAEYPWTSDRRNLVSWASKWLQTWFTEHVVDVQDADIRFRYQSMLETAEPITRKHKYVNSFYEQEAEGDDRYAERRAAFIRDQAQQPWAEALAWQIDDAYVMLSELVQAVPKTAHMRAKPRFVGFDTNKDIYGYNLGVAAFDEGGDQVAPRSIFLNPMAIASTALDAADARWAKVRPQSAAEPLLVSIVPHVERTDTQVRRGWRVWALDNRGKRTTLVTETLGEWASASTATYPPLSKTLQAVHDSAESTVVLHPFTSFQQLFEEAVLGQRGTIPVILLTAIEDAPPTRTRGDAAADPSALPTFTIRSTNADVTEAATLTDTDQALEQLYADRIVAREQYEAWTEVKSTRDRPSAPQVVTLQIRANTVEEAQALYVAAVLLPKFFTVTTQSDAAAATLDVTFTASAQPQTGAPYSTTLRIHLTENEDVFGALARAKLLFAHSMVQTPSILETAAGVSVIAADTLTDYVDQDRRQIRDAVTQLQLYNRLSDVKKLKELFLGGAPSKNSAYKQQVKLAFARWLTRTMIHEYAHEYTIKHTEDFSTYFGDVIAIAFDHVREMILETLNELDTHEDLFHPSNGLATLFNRDVYTRYAELFINQDLNSPLYAQYGSKDEPGRTSERGTEAANDRRRELPTRESSAESVSARDRGRRDVDARRYESTRLAVPADTRGDGDPGGVRRADNLQGRADEVSRRADARGTSDAARESGLLADDGGVPGLSGPDVRPASAAERDNGDARTLDLDAAAPARTTSQVAERVGRPLGPRDAGRDGGPAAEPAGRGGAAELDLPQLAPLDEPRDVDTARGMPSEDAAADLPPSLLPEPTLVDTPADGTAPIRLPAQATDLPLDLTAALNEQEPLDVDSARGMPSEDAPLEFPRVPPSAERAEALAAFEAQLAALDRAAARNPRLQGLLDALSPQERLVLGTQVRTISGLGAVDLAGLTPEHIAWMYEMAQTTREYGEPVSQDEIRRRGEALGVRTDWLEAQASSDTLTPATNVARLKKALTDGLLRLPEHFAQLLEREVTLLDGRTLPVRQFFTDLVGGQLLDRADNVTPLTPAQGLRLLPEASRRELTNAFQAFQQVTLAARGERRAGESLGRALAMLKWAPQAAQMQRTIARLEDVARTYQELNQFAARLVAGEQRLAELSRRDPATLTPAEQAELANPTYGLTEDERARATAASLWLAEQIDPTREGNVSEYLRDQSQEQADLLAAVTSEDAEADDKPLAQQTLGERLLRLDLTAQVARERLAAADRTEQRLERELTQLEARTLSNQASVQEQQQGKLLEQQLLELRAQRTHEELVLADVEAEQVRWLTYVRDTALARARRENARPGRLPALVDDTLTTFLDPDLADADTTELDPAALAAVDAILERTVVEELELATEETGEPSDARGMASARARKLPPELAAIYQRLRASVDPLDTRQKETPRLRRALLKTTDKNDRTRVTGLYDTGRELIRRLLTEAPSTGRRGTPRVADPDTLSSDMLALREVFSKLQTSPLGQVAASELHWLLEARRTRQGTQAEFLDTLAAELADGPALSTADAAQLRQWGERIYHAERNAIEQRMKRSLKAALSSASAMLREQQVEAAWLRNTTIQALMKARTARRTLIAEQQGLAGQAATAQDRAQTAQTRGQAAQADVYAARGQTLAADAQALDARVQAQDATIAALEGDARAAIETVNGYAPDQTERTLLRLEGLQLLSSMLDETQQDGQPDPDTQTAFARVLDDLDTLATPTDPTVPRTLEQLRAQRTRDALAAQQTRQDQQQAARETRTVQAAAKQQVDAQLAADLQAAGETRNGAVDALLKARTARRRTEAQQQRLLARGRQTRARGLNVDLRQQDAEIARLEAEARRAVDALNTLNPERAEARLLQLEAQSLLAELQDQETTGQVNRATLQALQEVLEQLRERAVATGDLRTARVQEGLVRQFQRQRTVAQRRVQRTSETEQLKELAAQARSLADLLRPRSQGGAAERFVTPGLKPPLAPFLEQMRALGTRGEARAQQLQDSIARTGLTRWLGRQATSPEELDRLLLAVGTMDPNNPDAIMQLLADASKPTKLQVLRSAVSDAMLSGWNTWWLGTNFLGMVTATAADLVFMRTGRAFFDTYFSAMSKLKGRPIEQVTTFGDVLAGWKAFPGAVTTAASLFGEFVRHGFNEQDLKRSMETADFSSLHHEYLMALALDGDKAKATRAALLLLAAIPTYTGRVRKGQELFFRALNEQVNLAELLAGEARRQTARQAPGTPPVTAEQVRRNLYKTPELLTVAANRADYASLQERLLAERAVSQGIQSVGRRARDKGKTSRTEDGVQLLRAVELPFLRTQTNAIWQGIEFTPILGSGIQALYRGPRALQNLADAKNATEKLEGRDELNTALTKYAGGLMLLGVTFWLLEQGILVPPEPPEDDTANEWLDAYPRGWNFKVGGRLYDLRQLPFWLPMSIIATAKDRTDRRMAQAKARGKDESWFLEFVNNFTTGMEAALKVVGAQSSLVELSSSLDELFGKVSGAPTRMAKSDEPWKWAGQKLGDYALQAVPTLWADLVAAQDLYERQATTYLESVARRVGVGYSADQGRLITRQDLPPALKLDGTPKENPKYGLWATLLPLTRSRPAPTKETEQFILDNQLNFPTAPRALQTTLSAQGRQQQVSVALTRSEQTVYQQAIGTRYQQYLEQALAAPMPDGSSQTIGAYLQRQTPAVVKSILTQEARGADSNLALRGNQGSPEFRLRRVLDEAREKARDEAKADVLEALMRTPERVLEIQREMYAQARIPLPPAFTRENIQLDLARIQAARLYADATPDEEPAARERLNAVLETTNEVLRTQGRQPNAPITTQAQARVDRFNMLRGYFGSFAQPAESSRR